MTRRFAGLLILLVVLASGLASCGGRKAGTPDERPVVSGIEIEAVKREVVAEIHEAAGTVRPKISATLSSQITGRILAVNVREGDRVTAGQVLVEIDGRDARMQLTRAEAGIDEATQTLDEIDKSILAAEAAKSAAEANQQLAAVTERRYKQLLDSKDISQQQYDEVNTRLRAASADVTSAAENINALEARRRAMLARVDQAKAESGSARISTTYTRITAPSQGVVAKRMADPGTMAAPGMPLLTIDDTRVWRLEASVEEARMASLSIGQEVAVAIDSLGGERLTGRVSEITPAADPASRTILVRIDLPGDARLRSGLYGRAEFTTGTVEIVSVPASALVERGQTTAVFVVGEDAAARLRFVTAGKRRGDRVEILSGLKDGERIVTSGTGRLTDGQRVSRQPGA